MVRATPFPSRVAEATAACRLDLAGGVLSSFPAAALPAGALSVAVAVDRRAFARVEAGTSGVEIESKDTLLKVAVPNVSSLSKDGVVGLVRRVLVGLDVETGLRVVTQARVPFEAGLASAGALAIAVAAAATRATGRELSAEALAAFARHADEGPGGGTHGAGGCARLGARGCDLCAPRPGTRCTPASGPGPRGGMPDSRGSSLGARGPAAACGREQGSRRERDHRRGTAEWRARPRAAWPRSLPSQDGRAGLWRRAVTPSWRTSCAPSTGCARGSCPREIRERIRPIVAIAEAAGGGARLCGGGRGSLVLVWAEPGARSSGPREAAVRGLKAAGYRLFPCRVDLRGLEVEDV